MSGERYSRLAVSAGVLAIAVFALPGPLSAQTASGSVVGIVLSVKGEIMATRQALQVPLKAYATVDVGTILRLAPGAQLRFSHNKERATYEIAGPAVVTISQKGLTVEPAAAVVSRTDAKLPAESVAKGAAPPQGARSNLRVGGESLETTRAGLAAAPTPKAVAAEPRAAPKAMSRSERERLADEEAARKALQAAKAPSAQSPAVVASAAPAASAPKGASAKAETEFETLYLQALALERDGKAADAIRIYRRAARAGSGKAALRLGQIFEKGVPGVARDYAESLQWYQTAQNLGEEVPSAAARR